MRVSVGGLIHLDPYPNLGNIVKEIVPVMGCGGTFSSEFYEDARKKNIFRSHPDSQCTLALNEHVIAVERSTKDPTLITALITRNCRTGVETRYRSRCFADCTGDAVVARMMGAETMYGREPRTNSTSHWLLSGLTIR